MARRSQATFKLTPILGRPGRLGGGSSSGQQPFRRPLALGLHLEGGNSARAVGRSSLAHREDPTIDSTAVFRPTIDLGFEAPAHRLAPFEIRARQKLFELQKSPAFKPGTIPDDVVAEGNIPLVELYLKAGFSFGERSFEHACWASLHHSPLRFDLYLHALLQLGCTFDSSKHFPQCFEIPSAIPTLLKWAKKEDTAKCNWDNVGSKILKNLSSADLPALEALLTFLGKNRYCRETLCEEEGNWLAISFAKRFNDTRLDPGDAERALTAFLPFCFVIDGDMLAKIFRKLSREALVRFLETIRSYEERKACCRVYLVDHEVEDLLDAHQTPAAYRHVLFWASRCKLTSETYQQLLTAANQKTKPCHKRLGPLTNGSNDIEADFSDDDLEAFFDFIEGGDSFDDI